jgi:hypothetical protein
MNVISEEKSLGMGSGVADAVAFRVAFAFVNAAFWKFVVSTVLFKSATRG